MNGLCSLGLLILFLALPAAAKAEVINNSLGMKLVRIEPGDFQMGSTEGEFDEQPVHAVTISQPFYMSVTEVTNAQYEQFDPAHRALRGKRALSQEDDEAVLFVSWNEAMDFCKWLSEKEGKPYRLPTEAEWEYACRAGTTTPFSTGETLPFECQRAQEFDWAPKPVSLKVGQTRPNPWGLHDMHGNVEEWCYDIYGPYPSEPQTDPLGYASGDMRVSRGGSHNTELKSLRSANRLGALPEDKHWLIGFRVVQADLPNTVPMPPPEPPLWTKEVRQNTYDWSHGPDSHEPFFAKPESFVIIPADANGPLYDAHNHCPSITWCPNGDLLAVWFSTISERGREMTIAASRRRAGSDHWDPASEFFKAPDRNMTGSSLFHDGKGTIYHFNGLEAGAGWANLALVMRTSTDNGATWSKPRLIEPEHQPRNQVISGASCTADGVMIQACDAVYGGDGGAAIHISRDNGQTWNDPGAGAPAPAFVAGGQGGTIAGIHAGVVSLTDGRLMAFGRGDSIDGQMPMSLSVDMGRTWTYHASPWPPISGGQRLVLIRLSEGPLLFVSFTGPRDKEQTLPFVGADGQVFEGSGLFAAISEDEGASWPVRKLLTPWPGDYQTRGAIQSFHADETHAEPCGYMAATQTPDKMIHLISSGLHYQFNLAWLKS